MLTNNSTIKLLTRLWLLFICFIPLVLNAGAKHTIFNPPPDTLIQLTVDSLAHIPGDTLIYYDTIISDTIITTSISGDTVIDENLGRTRINAKVERFAKDSIVQDFVKRKIYLFGEATINYEDITLKANYIEVDLNTNTVFASGINDSTGKTIGSPEFTQEGQTFKSKTMTYNFDSKRGLITSVLTEDGNGYLHGETVKKLSDNTVNILHGTYTTCSLEENPHFGFKFKKSRVIPDSKIVTGPVYMEIEGMPTPLGLPFGFFPNKMGQTSGIVIPTYGEYTNRGFYLENGGYYWAINEYMDVELLGDIYSRGGWAVKPRFRYKKRYKFSGDISLGYATNIVGTKDAPDYSKSTDFKIRWSHRQDPKARPNSTFSADVNIVSGNYVKYNVVSTEDFLSNEFQSSVAYQKNWAGKYFLTLNASHRQNTKTHIVDVSLPEMTFTVNRFYPLKGLSNKRRFYDELSVSYTMNAKNNISTADSVLFDMVTLEQKMQYGAVHKVPVSLPMKVLKYFTLSNSVNLTDRMYGLSIRKFWENDTTVVGGDTLAPGVRIDTVPGFRNAYDFSFNTSLSTKLFGMVAFKKGPVRAIRHVLTPSINFSYTPDFSDEKFGYYGTYIDGNDNEVTYSHFEGSLYGSPPGQQSGRVGFSLGNNLEIKVASKKDTITGVKKIKLVESFSISGNYDLSKDSMNMSMITMSGRTTLWKNFNVQYGSVWDPYATDSAGVRINKYEWDVNRRLLRLDNTSWRLSFGFKLADKDFKKKENPKNADENEMDEIENNPDDYVDWAIPWSINFNYNFTYTNNLDYINFMRVPQETIVQTLSFSGQVNITPKWKFTFNSGWDFTSNKLSYTSINLYRDLHCWEMRFSWIPLGVRQSWNFSINVKASILQDLKLNKKKDFRDF
ncbi:MAG: LPS-assembly protein LptD [Bacteroidetes bacterium]|nr:LPS-assembly protein LptD [Bacteroidota bacterium]MBL6943331.1 LPS-assembly protein LptD [Bacteroidales bacterium]